jgi:hypothetical protein
VNALPPPLGLRLFSVGDGVGLGDGATDVVVVVGVVLDGPPEPLPPQAVNAPIEMTAATPRPAATRRLSRLFILEVQSASFGKTRYETELYRPELHGP